MKGLSKPYKQNQKKKKNDEFSIEGKNKTISINSYQADILGFDVNPLMSIFGIKNLKGGKK